MAKPKTVSRWQVTKALGHASLLGFSATKWVGSHWVPASTILTTLLCIIPVLPLIMLATLVYDAIASTVAFIPKFYTNYKNKDAFTTDLFANQHKSQLAISQGQVAKTTLSKSIWGFKATKRLHQSTTHWPTWLKVTLCIIPVIEVAYVASVLFDALTTLIGFLPALLVNATRHYYIYQSLKVAAEQKVQGKVVDQWQKVVKAAKVQRWFRSMIGVSKTKQRSQPAASTEPTNDLPVFLPPKEEPESNKTSATEPKVVSSQVHKFPNGDVVVEETLDDAAAKYYFRPDVDAQAPSTDAGTPLTLKVQDKEAQQREPIVASEQPSLNDGEPTVDSAPVYHAALTAVFVQRSEEALSTFQKEHPHVLSQEQLAAIRSFIQQEKTLLQAKTFPLTNSNKQILQTAQEALNQAATTITLVDVRVARQACVGACLEWKAAFEQQQQYVNQFLSGYEIVSPNVSQVIKDFTDNSAGLSGEYTKASNLALMASEASALHEDLQALQKAFTATNRQAVSALLAKLQPGNKVMGWLGAALNGVSKTFINIMLDPSDKKMQEDWQKQFQVQKTWLREQASLIKELLEKSEMVALKAKGALTQDNLDALRGIVLEIRKVQSEVVNTAPVVIEAARRLEVFSKQFAQQNQAHEAFNQVFHLKDRSLAECRQTLTACNKAVEGLNIAPDFRDELNQAEQLLDFWEQVATGFDTLDASALNQSLRTLRSKQDDNSTWLFAKLEAAQVFKVAARQLSGVSDDTTLPKDYEKASALWEQLKQIHAALLQDGFLAQEALQDQMAGFKGKIEAIVKAVGKQGQAVDFKEAFLKTFSLQATTTENMMSWKEQLRAFKGNALYSTLCSAIDEVDGLFSRYQSLSEHILYRANDGFEPFVAPTGQVHRVGRWLQSWAKDNRLEQLLAREKQWLAAQEKTVAQLMNLEQQCQALVDNEQIAYTQLEKLADQAAALQQQAIQVQGDVHNKDAVAPVLDAIAQEVEKARTYTEAHGQVEAMKKVVAGDEKAFFGQYKKIMAYALSEQFVSPNCLGQAIATLKADTIDAYYTKREQGFDSVLKKQFSRYAENSRTHNTLMDRTNLEDCVAGFCDRMGDEALLEARDRAKQAQGYARLAMDAVWLMGLQVYMQHHATASLNALQTIAGQKPPKRSKAKQALKQNIDLVVEKFRTAMVLVTDDDRQADKKCLEDMVDAAAELTRAKLGISEALVAQKGGAKKFSGLEQQITAFGQQVVDCSGQGLDCKEGAEALVNAVKPSFWDKAWYKAVVPAVQFGVVVAPIILDVAREHSEGKFDMTGKSRSDQIEAAVRGFVAVGVAVEGMRTVQQHSFKQGLLVAQARNVSDIAIRYCRGDKKRGDIPALQLFLERCAKQQLESKAAVIAQKAAEGVMVMECVSKLNEKASSVLNACVGDNHFINTFRAVKGGLHVKNGMASAAGANVAADALQLAEGLNKAFYLGEALSAYVSTSKALGKPTDGAVRDEVNALYEDGMGELLRALFKVSTCAFGDEAGHLGDVAGAIKDRGLEALQKIGPDVLEECRVIIYEHFKHCPDVQKAIVGAMLGSQKLLKVADEWWNADETPEALENKILFFDWMIQHPGLMGSLVQNTLMELCLNPQVQKAGGKIQKGLFSSTISGALNMTVDSMSFGLSALPGVKTGFRAINSSVANALTSVLTFKDNKVGRGLTGQGFTTQMAAAIGNDQSGFIRGVVDQKVMPLLQNMRQATFEALNQRLLKDGAEAPKDIAAEQSFIKDAVMPFVVGQGLQAWKANLVARIPQVDQGQSAKGLLVKQSARLLACVGINAATMVPGVPVVAVGAAAVGAAVKTANTVRQRYDGDSSEPNSTKLVVSGSGGGGAN